MTEVTNVLLKVRDKIAGGWCKGTMHYNEDGVDRYCLVGSLVEAGYCDAACDAAQALREHLPGWEGVDHSKTRTVPDHPLVVFNDDPRTTQQDVLNLIDKTLADLGGLP